MSTNVFTRYWNGHYSLAISFWVFNVLVPALMALPFYYAAPSDHFMEQAKEYVQRSDLRLILTLFLGFFAFVVVICVWLLVGLWRSARLARAARYARGKRAVGPALAQLFVVLSAGNSIYDLATSIYSERKTYLTIFQMSFLGDPDNLPYGIRLMRGGTEVLIDGGFKYGLTAAFVAATKDTPQLRVVHLSSGGGRAIEGLKLYEEIRRRGLDTYVSRFCASACTLAFAGGKQRSIRDDPVLGFHNESRYGVAVDNIDENTVKLVLGRAGCPTDFIKRVLATPPTDLWRPSPDELLKAHFVTEIVDDDRFAASDIGAYPTKDTVTKGYLADPHVALWAGSPQKDSFRAFVEKARRAFEEGASLEALFEIERKAYSAAIRRQLAQASDEPIRSYLALTTKIYQTLQAEDSASCYKLDRDELRLSRFVRYAGSDLVKQRFDLADKIFKESARASPPAKPVRDALQARLSRMLKETLSADDLAALDTVQTDPARQAGVCRAKIGLLRAVAAMGPTDGPMMLRVVLAAAPTGP